MQHIAHDLDEKPRTKDVILEENVNFDSLLLPNNVLQGLTASGFRRPSPIQLKAIPLGRCGFDLIVKSKSGTGKTLVFSIIALEAINVTRDQLQVLILVPAREIAVQIQEVLRSIGSFIDGLRVESFIGGLPLEADIKKAKRCHIAVGAPGRVKHLINLGALSTDSVRLFVLDEADKLMEDSFQGDINEIYNSLSQRKQLIASSATYPEELDAFLANYMLSPTHVSSENETPILLGLKQFVAVIKTNNPNVVQLMKAKNAALVEIFSRVQFTQCLVFSNYQTRAESVSNYLNQKAWSSSFVSAAQSQSKRLEAVKNLKDFKNRILLSTDLTSRGIDAPNVDLVINYDIPQDPVTYLHRMGRAGRYGSSGICINLALDGDELTQLQLILGAIGAALTISKLPPLHESTGDLWQLDVTTLEQIGAVVAATSNKISEDIKREVMALKQKSKKGRGKKKAKLEDCVKAILDDKEKEMEEVYEKLSIVDTETILNSLVSEPKVENLNQDTNYIFCKNRALLTITKLLCVPTSQVDADAVNTIEEYLTILKNQEVEDSEVTSLEDILSRTNKTLTKTDDNVVEDIFKAAYECAVGGEGKSWLDCLPPDELRRFRDLDREEVVISSGSEDFEMDVEDDEVIAEDSDQNQDIALQWVPVVQSDTCEPYSEHFAKCYEDCSNNLWQQGLTFDSVDAFDDWFYQWQEQLQSVRNYVQQNIYVEEMGKYQQNKLTNK